MEGWANTSQRFCMYYSRYSLEMMTSSTLCLPLPLVNTHYLQLSSYLHCLLLSLSLLIILHLYSNCPSSYVHHKVKKCTENKRQKDEELNHHADRDLESRLKRQRKRGTEPHSLSAESNPTPCCCSDVDILSGCNGDLEGKVNCCDESRVN